MSDNHTNKLQSLETALKERGVVDVKFFFDHHRKPMTGLVGEVEVMLKAVLDGRFDKAAPMGNSYC